MAPVKLLVSLAAIFIVTSSRCHANPFSGFGVYCKMEMFKLEIAKQGCDPEKVTVNACLGTCASYAQPLEYAPYFMKVCDCCKTTKTEQKSFQLENCGPGVSPFVQVETATGCGCHATDCT